MWEEQPVPLFRLPVAGTIAFHRFVTGADSIPVRDDSVSQVELAPLLEFVLDEITLLTECYRVLQPGGSISGVVPNATGFGSIDMINLLRYSRDVIKRGPPLPELAESGWRRHFSADELFALLRETGFSEVEIEGTGTIGPEIRIGRQLARRWVQGRPSQALEDTFLAGSSRRPGLPASLAARLLFRARKF